MEKALEFGKNSRMIIADTVYNGNKCIKVAKQYTKDGGEVWNHTKQTTLIPLENKQELADWLRGCADELENEETEA